MADNDDVDMSLFLTVKPVSVTLHGWINDFDAIVINLPHGVGVV